MQLKLGSSLVMKTVNKNPSWGFCPCTCPTAGPVHLIPTFGVHFSTTQASNSTLIRPKFNASKPMLAHHTEAFGENATWRSRSLEIT